jgi:regulator of RNase E activity RraA
MKSQSLDIVRDFPRISPDLVAQASAFQPAILADVAGRRGALHGRIAALRHRMKMACSALKVEVRPGDNLMIHAAIALARPGDVLVIDGKGDQTAALMGTIMMNACRQVGIAGVVVDGAVRDSLEIDEMDFPVFSVGTNPNGPTKLASGRIGHPVSVGGVTVRSGDLVVGDADGVVVVERIQREVAKVLATPDIAKRLAADGLEPVGSTPEQFRAFLAADKRKWGRVVKDADVKAE